MISLIAISEGIRMFKRSLKVRKHGFHRYLGKEEEICRKIIDDCWNIDKEYFQVSSGHFNVFFSRDFSWCVKPLINLGYADRVNKTLEYALKIFSKKEKIYCAINPKGKPFDFPNYAVDSLPSMMRALRMAKSEKLVKKFRPLIQKETKRLFRIAVDKDGMVRKDKYFSSIKDHAKRKSSCYDNCMLGMLSDDLDYFKLDNPFSQYMFRDLIKKHFWNKTFFLNDLSGDKSITGDSNVFPYWTGLFSDSKMIKSSLNALQKERLDNPFPLKYHQKENDHRMSFTDFFARDYETDSIWGHIGLLLADVIVEADKKQAKKYLESYSKKIKEFSTFLEVFDCFGHPYHSPFYFTDEGMLWCSLYLDLKKKLD